MQHLSKAQIKWVRQLQQKKFRDAEGVFVAEGEKCVHDLTDAFELVLLVSPDNATPTEIEQMSSLRTPQGVIGVFKRREAIGDGVLVMGHGLWVALDGVQDPGNLGTIIRTCDWFGIHHIICSRETADCYNPKVVQATMGALARVQLHYVDDLSSVLSKYQQNGYPIYGTLLNGKNMYEPSAIPTKDKGIIVMGNEGNGISQSVRECVTHPLLIPSYPADMPTSESLNVGIATAIVLAEFRRNNLP
ncbi:MAG: RNA methyltransferase [Bacteroidales bacterium]|nr:RNA methyltransferase [Bacteroidales bacterium]